MQKNNIQQQRIYFNGTDYYRVTSSLVRMLGGKPYVAAYQGLTSLNSNNSNPKKM